MDKTSFNNPLGVGLRAPHYEEFLAQCPDIGWVEIHPENYFGAGGKPRFFLEKIAAIYPISLHGVGLSIGSVDELNVTYLSKLKTLINNFDPIFVSDHLSWSSINGYFYHDLLPLPLTEESLIHCAERINIIQDSLQRTLLIENISYYLKCNHSTIMEQDFLAELVKRTGCKLLLDLNNLYVNSINQNIDIEVFLATLPIESIEEIHVAGHTVNQVGERSVLIDTHDKPVCEEVWQLYKKVILQLGRPVATLLEWDKALPPLAILIKEAKRAQVIMEDCYAIA